MKQPPVEHEVLIVTKTLYSDKDKEYVGRKTGVMDVNIYTERISGYLEGECFGRLGDQKVGVSISWRLQQESRTIK